MGDRKRGGRCPHCHIDLLPNEIRNRNVRFEERTQTETITGDCPKCDKKLVFTKKPRVSPTEQMPETQECPTCHYPIRRVKDLKMPTEWVDDLHNRKMKTGFCPRCDARLTFYAKNKRVFVQGWAA